jgi:RNA polymerase sigma-70 factor, ECF subfamily
LSEELRTIIERCLAGDQAAMRLLVEQYRDNVFGLCVRMLGRLHDAEDAAQDVFLRVFRSLHHLDLSRELEPWLLAITGNCCRTRLKQRSRRPETSPLTDDAWDDSAPTHSGDELAEEVRLGLSRLREEHRRAFLLFHEQELNYAEIAAVLEIPLGTVKTWVHRARRELIEHLQQRGVVEEPRHVVRKV